MNVLYSKFLLARFRLPVSSVTFASIISMAVLPSTPAFVRVADHGTEQRNANLDEEGGNTLRGERLWISAWTSPAVSPPDADYPVAVREFRNQTVRQMFRVGAHGSKIRLVLTNELGDASLSVGAVHFAKCDEQGLLIAESDRTLTFGGQRAIKIAPGAPAYSDPIDFDISTDTEVAVSIFFPERSRPSGPTHLGSE